MSETVRTWDLWCRWLCSCSRASAFHASVSNIVRSDIHTQLVDAQRFVRLLGHAPAWWLGRAPACGWGRAPACGAGALNTPASAKP